MKRVLVPSLLALFPTLLTCRHDDLGPSSEQETVQSLALNTFAAFEQPIEGYDGPTCDTVVQVSHHRWAALCSQSGTCGSHTDFAIIDANGTPRVLYRTDQYYSAYFRERIEGHDVDGDGVDEIFVIATSEDPEYGTSVPLGIWQHRGDQVVDLWDGVPAYPQADAEGNTPWFFVLDYEVTDFDGDGHVEVVTWSGASFDRAELTASAKGAVWRWTGATFQRDEVFETTSDFAGARERWIERYAAVD